jgi:hypothetical protein
VAYRFPFQWFENYTLDVWSRLLLPHLGDVRNYLECGVAHGQSLIWVLENLLAGKENGKADGVDPYFPARQFGDHPREAAERKLILQANLCEWSGERNFGDTPQGITKRLWQKPNGPTCEMHFESSASFLIDAKRTEPVYDLFYCDGNHNASDALLDIVLGWRLLRVGGVMVCDDLDQRYRGNRPRAWHAVRGWMDCNDGFFDTIYVHQRQAAFRKIERRRKGDPPVLTIGEPIPPRK